MSHAFVKEEDAEWLHDVPPTMHALIAYLTRESNTRVYEKKIMIDPKSGKEVHEMSNGLSYTKDEDNKWIVVW